MEFEITMSELVQLLSIAWLPSFAVAAVVQFAGLRRVGLTRPGPRRRATMILIAAFVVEFALASTLLLSPLNRVALPMHFLGSFEVVGVPFQAGIVAATAVTAGGLHWLARMSRSRSE